MIPAFILNLSLALATDPRRSLILRSMDQTTHPIDWWAYGGYAEVARQTGWSLARARREVRKSFRLHGLRPIGHRGYAELRRTILSGGLLNNDLV